MCLSAALPHCSILHTLGGWEENKEEDMGYTDPLYHIAGLEVCFSHCCEWIEHAPPNCRCCQ